MYIRKEEKVAKEKIRVDKNNKTLAADPPAPFPIFPFGLFLLPLIVPGMSPAAPKDAKNQNKSPISK